MKVRIHTRYRHTNNSDKDLTYLHLIRSVAVHYLGEKQDHMCIKK